MNQNGFMQSEQAGKTQEKHPVPSQSSRTDKKIFIFQS